MSLVNVILRNQTVEEYLKRILRNIDGYQRGLTAQDDWVEKLKIAVTAPLNSVFRRFGRPLTRNKTDEEAEKFFSTSASPDDVEVALTDGGYSRNLISTKKYIIRDGKQIWAVGSYRIVYGEDNRFQHHVYLIPREDGGTDVYGHKETNYEYDPSGHVSNRQWYGDPDGKATPLLEGV